MENWKLVHETEGIMGCEKMMEPDYEFFEASTAICIGVFLLIIFIVSVNFFRGEK